MFYLKCYGDAHLEGNSLNHACVPAIPEIQQTIFFTPETKLLSPLNAYSDLDVTTVT